MKTKLEVKRTRKIRPAFIRQQASYSKFRKKKWRYPRGKSSKIRLNISGHKVTPSIGYGSSGDERFLNRYGLSEVLVTNEKGLLHLNPSKHAVVLSGNLGLKKRIELLQKLKEKNLHVMNIHDIDEYIKNIHDIMKQKKEDKNAKLTKKKETKKKEDKPKVKQEEKAESIQEKTIEEKEKEIREEQRKVLERKA